MSTIEKLRESTSTLWVSHKAPSEPIAIPWRVNHIGRIILWPIAVMLIIHAVFILAVNGSVTDDFTTVYQALRRFIDGINVYNENYTYVDPHYLYSPGATLFLAPLAVLGGLFRVRMAFIFLNAIAIVLALGISTRLVGYRMSSVVFPGAVVAAFLTESVRNTLVFSNINGILLLALVLFLISLVNNHPWWAGIFIGFAILIKPIFLPLLFLPLVYLYWQTIIVAIAIPVVLNLIAWPLVPGASDYISRTMPYISEVRDFSNSSLSGQAVYFGIGNGPRLVIAALIALIIIIGLVFLLRIRHSDPVLWVTASSSLLLAGVFFLSSLGQMYYSMLLFPVVLTLFRSVSTMHVWTMWFALYAIYSPQSWELDNIQGRIRPAGEVFGQMPNPVWGQWLLPLLPCLGWCAFILITATTAFYWWFEERGQVHIEAHKEAKEVRTAPSDVTA
ncbi:MAG: glycosyltransferase family 87 protein [Corynebacterium sp.]|nr:glycosyltransferase family 87 protein [Corynebacterium sp.]